jgi:pimeloyl-ACP methyl ester carboxylesterase
MIDVGGYRLHVSCTGRGSPTVIAEAGAGDFSTVWRHVQRAVATRTRFCSYDRAGSGWSDYSGQIPTPERVSADLRLALTTAGIDGPYVLVGHSLGGIYARDFYSRHPTNVVGMVLVDSSHENQNLRAPAATMRQQSRAMGAMGAMLRLCTAASVVGVVRATRFWWLVTSDMSEDARTAYSVTRSRTRFCSAMREAILAFGSATGQSRPPQSLGSLPLAVLAHGRTTARSSEEAEWEGVFRTLQTELASLSSDSTFRIVADAGHNIQVDDPAVVSGAIVEMVEKVRR